MMSSEWAPKPCTQTHLSRLLVTGGLAQERNEDKRLFLYKQKKKEKNTVNLRLGCANTLRLFGVCDEQLFNCLKRNDKMPLKGVPYQSRIMASAPLRSTTYGKIRRGVFSRYVYGVISQTSL